MDTPIPDPDEDIAELTAAARAGAATGRPPAPNGVAQEQVYKVVRDIRWRRLPDTPKVRRVARSELETELRRIDVIGHGVRVRKGGDLDEMLDTLVEWVLSPVPAERFELAGRSLCLVCESIHWDGGAQSDDGLVACDLCSLAAIYTGETGGQRWHHCDECASWLTAR